jgi:predicted nucleotidyltransferase
MSSDGDHSEVFSDLAAGLCADEDVDFAVVFGSQVANAARESSDVDVAVKFADSLSASERFQKRCFLAGDLQQDGSPFVDISDIDRLPLDVAHDAIHGEFLCGDDERFRAFKTDVEAQFTDQREGIQRRQRDTIDRIAEDGLHG